MSRLTVVVAVGALFITATPSASATPPLRERLTFPIAFVDDETCAFRVTVDLVFTNAIGEFVEADGVMRTLHLNQSTVGTMSANGRTLTVNIRETIIVEFDDGIPVRARHVGVLDAIRGPGGPLFLRTGQALFEVVFDPVSGFFVDGPLLARHGLRATFDADRFCAALAA